MHICTDTHGDRPNKTKKNRNIRQRRQSAATATTAKATTTQFDGDIQQQKKKQFDACGTLTKANVEKEKRENCNPTVTNKTLVCARLVCVVHTRTKKKRSRQLAASSGKRKTVLRWMVEVYTLDLDNPQQWARKMLKIDSSSRARSNAQWSENSYEKRSNFFSYESGHYGETKSGDERRHPMALE